MQSNAKHCKEEQINATQCKAKHCNAKQSKAKQRKAKKVPFIDKRNYLSGVAPGSYVVYSHEREEAAERGAP